MPDASSRFASRILDKTEPGADSQSYSKEQTAQAFNLHVERRDGRMAEGFGWSHYAGYRWSDEGERERLVVLFGNRAVEIEGRKLGILVGQIREGQLSGIRELASRQATLLEHDGGDSQPVIMSVRTYPEFEEILNEIKGEDDDDKRRHAGRVSGR